MKNKKFSVLNIFLFPAYILAIFLIYIYKLFISPLIPHTCRYTPTCSTYMMTAIKQFGLLKGVKLGTKRILRCNSHSKSCGLDLVPDNIKGDFRWLI